MYAATCAFKRPEAQSFHSVIPEVQVSPSAIQTMTEIVWDAIPGVSLRGHRARWMRLYAIYVPYVLGYVVVAFAAGLAELKVAEMAHDASAAALANFFAFIMLFIGTSSILMTIPGFLSMVKTIREDEGM